MKRQPKPKAEETFPLPITKGSVTVIIYKTRNRGADTFTVAYKSGGRRTLKQFRDLDKAKKEAATCASNMEQGDLQALKLTGQERQLYVAAAEALKPTGITLDVAAREFALAFEILGRDGIIEAARYFKRQVDTALPDITATEAVAKFAEAKEREGMSPLYLKDIRGSDPTGEPKGLLGRLAKAFQCNLKDITADDLQGYLARLKVGPVARNNHRRLIVALFNFAKAQGWLNKSESTAADGLGTVKVKEEVVGIYTPAEMKALLSAADADFLPWLLLIGFGGIRREELAKGLSWEDVDFKRGCVIVPAAIAKTGRRRKIEMATNLKAWLKHYENETGPIFDIDPRKRMAKVTVASEVAWKRNALRHSFCSYRMEQTKNAGQVALEAGNSPSVIMRHYHEIVHAKDAKAYWNIRPASKGAVAKGKIIPMREAA